MKLEPTLKHIGDVYWSDSSATFTPEERGEAMNEEERAALTKLARARYLPEGELGDLGDILRRACLAAFYSKDGDLYLLCTGAGYRALGWAWDAAKNEWQEGGKDA